ncbi:MULTISPECIES: hypothetical protein [Chryseobacterium]|uniref:Oxidoreductase n=1 Tax=Chryseobacterium camelliae TaxID=1265445 RepID=A0ABU0TNH6_9FLAO|nr:MULTISPECIES: hypothetical protein [Chryseobacterium]MDT3407555.1 hypothetical protein [Pseudacidovorax intermedius]MDQ1098592.1 hypothetical protein [Chryseobacterium camelliae]MDQ1102516.1 hypothetical protein [Chryseobacterium sp. SORGH_AS_1048]MDR6085950.1 hypothetical protein [Chryseobacterium sp. SORGH_AS_0909]MDR6130316.1 hypothetical protein [Chryseobacterium sp. SORGH_AS_1175]
MKKQVIIILISLVLFMASLPFTAVYSGNNEIGGLTCLLLGWAEPERGGIAWFANPIFFISAFFLLFRLAKISAVLSLIAVVLTFCYLSVGEITIDEAGYRYPITSYGIGYYLWIASCISLFIGSLILLKPKKEV